MPKSWQTSLEFLRAFALALRNRVTYDFRTNPGLWLGFAFAIPIPDCIDIFGWLGYPLQIKVDFLCRDSILAAPLVLDLVLLTDFAQRAGMSGIQEWLSFYFKNPMVKENLYPEHDLLIQLMKLKNTLRYLMGEEQITHFGLGLLHEAGQ